MKNIDKIQNKINMYETQINYYMHMIECENNIIKKTELKKICDNLQDKANKLIFSVIFNNKEL